MFFRSKHVLSPSNITVFLNDLTSASPTLDFVSEHSRHARRTKVQTAVPTTQSSCKEVVFQCNDFFHHYTEDLKHIFCGETVTEIKKKNHTLHLSMATVPSLVLLFVI